jgi:hypothetical protein
MSEEANKQKSAEERNFVDRYGGLYHEVLHALYEHDPIGISYMPDEYARETRTILPRLNEASSVDDVNDLIYEEFVHWFGKDVAGTKEKYRPAAEAIWALWMRHFGSLQL